MFIPVNIEGKKLTQAVVSGEGEETVTTEEVVQGYEYDEYRINKAEGLPDEAVSALAEAFHIEHEALKILGVV